ncbi:MAG: FAD-dependent oxidoreductase, partial [Bacillota bacterium]
ATYEEMENYPGVPETTAPELMENFKTHAEKFNAEFARGEVVDIDTEGFKKVVKTKDGDEYTARSIILATGAEPRKLGIKGEKEFKGRGVSYCATCDADFYVDMDVVVVGNGNSAVEEAIYLTKFARKVTIIVIHEEGVMDAEKLFQERAFANEKIDFVWNSTVEEIKGDGLVDSVILKNIKTGEKTEMSCDGVFFFVGRVPSTDFLEDTEIELSENNYIKANDNMETNVPGIYAAGDVRDKVVRQVITAAGDGATAAVMAQGYIEAEEYWQENVIHSDKPVIVAFWSPTHEESIDKIGELEDMNLENKGYKMVKIDTYKNKLITDRYNVSEIPTVIKIEDGEVMERLVSPDIDEIKEIL